jgi:CBS domain-containing protein
MDFESSGCEFDPRRGRLFYANFAKRGGNMTTIRELIQKKGSEIWSIAPDGSALDALKLMGEKNVGALMVLSSDRNQGQRDHDQQSTLRRGQPPARGMYGADD